MFSKSIITGSLALVAAAAFSASSAQAQTLFASAQNPAYPQYQATQDDQSADDAQLDRRLQRQIVAYATNEAPSTFIIDTPHTFSFRARQRPGRSATAVGVGREGFAWAGVRHRRAQGRVAGLVSAVRR